MYKREGIPLVFAAIAVAAAGCGGGQGGGPVAAAVKTTKAGDAVITYFGQPKPQLTSSAGYVTVVGQAGATFSTVTLEPPPNLADTYIAFGRIAEGASELYAMPYATETPQMLYQGVLGADDVGISAYGAVGFTNCSNQPYSIRPD